MRFLAGICGLLIGYPVYAQEPEQIIRSAIVAAGGKEKLALFLTVHARGTGKLHVGKDYIPFTFESWFQHPDQSKTIYVFNEDGKRWTDIRVLDRNKGWQSWEGVTTECNERDLGQLKEAAYAYYLNTLFPLLEDKAIMLSKVDDIRVAGRPAAGIRVSTKGYSDMTLYFDKETSRVVKTVGKMIDKDDKEYIMTEFPSDFRDTKWGKMPFKLSVLLDDKRLIDTETTEIRPLERIDPSVFGRP